MITATLDKRAVLSCELFAGAVVFVLDFKAEANGKGGNQILDCLDGQIPDSFVFVEHSENNSGSYVNPTTVVICDTIEGLQEFDNTFPYA